jgi:hypothetical protein
VSRQIRRLGRGPIVKLEGVFFLEFAIDECLTEAQTMIAIDKKREKVVTSYHLCVKP